MHGLEARPDLLYESIHTPQKRLDLEPHNNVKLLANPNTSENNLATFSGFRLRLSRATQWRTPKSLPRAQVGERLWQRERRLRAVVEGRSRLRMTERRLYKLWYGMPVVQIDSA